MKLLIKIGGTLVDDEAKRHAIAEQVMQLAHAHQVVAVHGGGKQLTRFLEERGVASQFVKGLRVSDASVMDAVVKVIAGTVNKQLVTAIVRAGQPAIGLSGVDGPLTLAIRLDAELGSVGRPVKTAGHLFHLLLSSGYVPVVACIAGDEQGNIYNVNADQMAVSCAIGWGADKLLFLTDVEGVKDGMGEIVRELTLDSVSALVESGVAHGGMQAKLEAATLAVANGISQVVIAAGHIPGVCKRLMNGESLGTRVSAEKPAMEDLRA